MMAVIEGVRMSVISCSNLTADILAALFIVWICHNTSGIEACLCVIEYIMSKHQHCTFQKNMFCWLKTKNISPCCRHF